MDKQTRHVALQLKRSAFRVPSPSRRERSQGRCRWVPRDARPRRAPARAACSSRSSRELRSAIMHNLQAQNLDLQVHFRMVYNSQS